MHKGSNDSSIAKRSQKGGLCRCVLTHWHCIVEVKDERLSEVLPCTQMNVDQMASNLVIGSNEHKRLFCRTFSDSHIRYSPEEILWPVLPEADLERLQSVPIWKTRLEFKRWAGVVTRAYAQSLTDPLVKGAITLYSKEQQRHGSVLEAFMQQYGILVPMLSPLPVPPKPDVAFIDVGYTTALDLFVDAGLFTVLRQYQCLPPELLQVWDRILAEKTRHLGLFVNCLAYQKTKQKATFGYPFRGLLVLWQRRNALLRLLGSCGEKEDPEDYPLAQHWLASVTAEQFLDLCLQEHHRRIQALPADLVQPQFSTVLAKVTREVLRVWPKRYSSPTISSLNP